MKRWPFGNSLSRHLLMALIGVACLTGTPAQATGPAANSVAYQETGKVDDIHLSQNQIVINDRAYLLAGNVSIVAGNKSSSKNALRKGMNLGFNFTEDRQKSVITEIWILPAR